MHNISWEWWGPRWNNWSVGIRWENRNWLRFIALDLGPFCLCLEWESNEEAKGE